AIRLSKNAQTERYYLQFRFEHGNFSGITYLNTFFIRQDDVSNEAIHFHELIHVIKWRILGPEQFLSLYSDGLERFGYRDSPLEKMAYDAEAAFTQTKYSTQRRWWLKS